MCKSETLKDALETTTATKQAQIPVKRKQNRALLNGGGDLNGGGMFFLCREHKTIYLATTTAPQRNRALGRQVYGRYLNPGKHRKIISTIAFAGSAKIGGAAVVVDSSVLPAL